MGDRDFSTMVLSQQCFQASFTGRKTSVHEQNRYPPTDSCLFFFLNPEEAQRNKTHPSWGNINNFTLLQESEERLWSPDFQSVWEASRRNIFKYSTLPLSHCLLVRQIRTCQFPGGGALCTWPSHSKKCAYHLVETFCSSFYKGPILLLSKMQT